MNWILENCATIWFWGDFFLIHFIHSIWQILENFSNYFNEVSVSRAVTQTDVTSAMSEQLVYFVSQIQFSGHGPWLGCKPSQNWNFGNTTLKKTQNISKYYIMCLQTFSKIFGTYKKFLRVETAKICLFRGFYTRPTQ